MLKIIFLPLKQSQQFTNYLFFVIKMNYLQIKYARKIKGFVGICRYVSIRSLG